MYSNAKQQLSSFRRFLHILKVTISKILIVQIKVFEPRSFFSQASKKLFYVANFKRCHLHEQFFYCFFWASLRGPIYFDLIIVLRFWIHVIKNYPKRSNFGHIFFTHFLAPHGVNITKIRDF